MPQNTLVAVDGARVTQGKTDDTYGWDNEYGTLTTDVKPFKASKMLTSNAEFFEFVAAGGYQDARWWDEEGLWLARLCQSHSANVLGRFCRRA